MSANLPLVPQFIENFIQNFAAKRQAAAAQQVEIKQRRLYILPTRHGVVFFLMLLLILLAAINYENSLAFMLAFLLGSISFLTMIYTHQNINHLLVRVGRAEPVFVGQHVLFPISISQKPSAATPVSRPNIQLLSGTGQSVNAHLLNESSTECRLAITASQRGYLSVGRIKLFSEYPFGLFHAWSWLNMQSRCLVYPAPAPDHYPLLMAEKDAQGNKQNKQAGADDFAGIREYQPSDKRNQMAWKAIAKTGVLQTKLFTAEAAEEISINWSQLMTTQDIETRLSILTRMVLDADTQNLVYALHIPGADIPAACGLQHKHSCLSALALYGQADGQTDDQTDSHADSQADGQAEK